MLIEGVHSLSFGPAKQHEWNLFTCINSRTIEHMVSLTSRQMISTALSKLRAIQEHARVLALRSHRHNMVDFGITFVMQKSLLCNLQITRDSVSMVALCGGAPFTVLCTFFVTLHLPFAWIYHIPCNIAIIIVRYHMEVDKLVVWR